MKNNIRLLILAACGTSPVLAQTPDSLSSAMISNETEYGRGILYSQKESSAAVSTTNPDDLKHKTSINPSNLLYGLIPGLQVLQNAGNAWDDGATLHVRGIGTSNSSAPLVLVDGFERPLDNLSSSDIESVTVLKDAVSTALYGIKGANGVILVKTKRGTDSTPEIGFSYQFNMGTPKDLPLFVNAYTHAHALNEGLTNDGSSPRYSNAELRAFRDGTYPDFYPNVDWTNEALRKHSFGDNVSFSARGGGEYVKYYTQLNYMDDRGILKPTDWNDGYSTQFKYSRMNIRTNLDIKLSHTTKAKLNMFGNFSEQNRPGQTADAIFEALYKVPSGAFPVKTSNGVYGGTTIYGNNPVAYIAGSGYVRTQGRVLYADLGIEQDLSFLTKGLSFGIKIGLDNYTTYMDNNTKSFGYESAIMDMASGSQRYTNLRNEGTLNFGNSVETSSNHFNLEARADYRKEWKGGHKLAATLLYAMDKNTAKDQNKSRAFMDIAAQAHYVYKDRYVIDFSLSGSAASVLEPGHQWGIFPATGAAWILSEESFLKRDWLDLLKIRASYGISGRADYDMNLYKHLYGSGGSYIFMNNPQSFAGLKETLLGVEGLTYEKSHKANAGIDFSAWRRLSISIDAFYDHRTDILTDASGTVSSILGISVPKQNNGIIDSYGTELSARWSDQIKDFTYHLGGTFSFTRNKIIRMNEQYRLYDYLKRTGNPVGQIFGYEVVGIYQNQEQIDSREVKQYLSEVRPGDLMFKDQNGDLRIDENDMVPLGYNETCPEIYYSFNLGMEYKGFGVYVLFQGATNYSKVLSVNSVYRPLVYNNTVSAHYYKNRWTPENPNARYPRLTYAGSANNYNNNSVWVADASFLKLRTLEMYYQIPTSILKKTKAIKSTRIFARAHDLFSLNGLEVMDPEAVEDGHPLMTQYTFGVNFSF